MFKQGDQKWANLKINGTSSTMKNYGCFITCLAELAGITPPEALKTLEKGKAFSGDLIISDKAAKALNLELDPIRRSADFKPNHTCIVEVDYKPETSAKDQHFCVYFPDGTIGDPIDGKVKKNPYRIISFRLFKAKETIDWKKKYEDAEELAEEAREDCARIQKQLDNLETDHLKELLPMQQDIDELKRQLSTEQTISYNLNQTNQNLVTKNNDLKNEVDRLNNIQGLNVEKTSVPNAVKFLLEVIFKSKK
jgi:hypothetical protein